MTGTFTCDDLVALSEAVTTAWQGGRDLDWSALAGTLEWTCAQTADHAIDTVLAPAFFLASRKLDDYPDGGWSPGPEATPDQFIEALRTVTRIVVAVVRASPPESRAVIWRRPAIEVRGPEDFPARAGLELAIHGQDVCSGLGVPFEPPAAVVDRLCHQTSAWPFWGSYWGPLTIGPDPWVSLLRATGRR